MWRAVVALEIIYTLISEHIGTLLAVNNTNNYNINNNNKLVRVIVEAVCDFSIVASSSRVRIMRVLDVVQWGEYDNKVGEVLQQQQGSGEMVGDLEERRSGLD